MLLGAALAVVMVVINLAMPHRLRLIGVAVLLFPQFYIPGFPISLATLWTVLTCAAGLITRGRSRADSPLVVIFGLFVAVTAFSLLWALPAGMYLGVVSVAYGLVFLLWLREVIVVARDSPALLDTIVIWLIPGLTVQSLLIILFRISPGIEERFLRSSLASFTVGPAAAHLYTDLPNNVLDPAKAGGFFPNGNAASLCGGVAGLLLCIAARRSMQRWVYWFAALSFTGALATGSKSFLAIGAVVAVMIAVLPRAVKPSAFVGAIGLFLLIALMAPVISALLERVAPGIYAASDSSANTRGRLWSRAVQVLQESPFLGSGFGGWTEQVGRIGSRHDLPPHNYIISAWVNSGIVAAILSVAFVFATIALGLRVTSAQRTLRDRSTAALALCIPAWVFLHGLGDNTGFYGDRHDMILFALAIGYLYCMEQDARPIVPMDVRPESAASKQIGRPSSL